ncbi:hypothetical protein BVY00_01440 [bacterium G20]|nr:hypothetical protein BVY00_01440 [bacterium G20]
MSKHQRIRHLRQPLTSVDQPIRKKEKEEIPELWEVRGARLPGNPRYTDHAPEYTHIVDAQGERVCVIEARLVRFSASSAGIETIRKLSKPQQAGQLWIGQEHHVLTNALRLLQACTITASGQGPDHINERRLREGVTPTQLLHQTGLLPDQTSQVLQKLNQMGLLQSRGREGKTPVWFVNVLVKGVSSSGEKYQAHQLVDGWELPDEIISPAAVPSPRSNPAPTPTEKGDEVAPARGLRDNRHEYYNLVYQASLKYVPEQPEFEDGFAVFTTPGPLTELVASELGITKSQAGFVLQDLTVLEIYWAQMIGAGRWKRYIKLGEGPFTKEHVRQVRSSRRVSKVKDAATYGGRYAHLIDAYNVLLQTVPEGAEPDDQGFVEYQTNFSFTELVAQKLEGVSARTADRLLVDLSVLGVLQTRTVFGGRIRRLKLGIVHFTEKDVEKIQKANKRRRTTPQPSSPAPAPESSNIAVPMTPEQLGKLLVRMDQRIKTLEADLQAECEAHAATKAELEAARAAAAQIVEIPTDLVSKYLDN